MFALLFFVGAVGFAAMAALSVGHVGSGRAGTHLPATHVPATHLSTHVQPATGLSRLAPGRWSPASWLSVSLLDGFSLALGFGAAGLLLQARLAGGLLIVAAVACALAYDLVLIRPVMSLLLRFASKESGGLGATLGYEAEALGGFDASGRGLVRVEMDGQLVQLLATLDPDELERGVRVARGDRVVIVAVDPSRNRCRVSRDLAA